VDLTRVDRCRAGVPMGACWVQGGLESGGPVQGGGTHGCVLGPRLSQCKLITMQGGYSVRLYSAMGSVGDS
jgi:hypothetical protein